MAAIRGGRAELAWLMSCAGLLGAAVWAGSCERAKPSPPAKRSPAAGGAVAGSPVSSGDQSKPAPIPGWYMVLTPARTGEAAPAEVQGHMVRGAFALEPGQSLHPSVPGEGLGVSLSSRVRIEEPGRYRFEAEGDGGRIAVSVFGGTGEALGKASVDAAKGAAAARTDWIDLKRGEVTLSVRFNRNGDEPARLRTRWEQQQTGSTGFRLEPIPPEATSVPANGRAAAEKSLTALHGRVLLGELNCISCHHGGSGVITSVVRRKAPQVAEAGRAFGAEWLMRWVSDPQTIKPGCGMPVVFTPEDASAAESVVHFLMSLSTPGPFEPVATEARVLDQGRRLFHTTGCIACHGALESPAAVFNDPTFSAEVPVESVSAPFGDLAGKWRPGPLAEFLAEPTRTHPGGRMPSMALSTSDADLIATYLITRWGAAPATPFAVDTAKSAAGRAVFASKCASCHQIGGNLPDVASTAEAKAMTDLKSIGGCLDPADRATPRYTISDADRAALAAAIEEVKPIANGSPSPVDMGRRVVEAFGCRNCHVYDGSGGPAGGLRAYFRTQDETELGDEGRLPPILSGVGWKLNTPWLHRVFSEAGRARPYMAAVMPQWGEGTIDAMPELLAAMDGVWPNSGVEEPTPSDEMVLAGRRLTGAAGLNCISCHVWGDAPPAGTPGPDITEFAGRIRHEWWKTYIMDPKRFKPDTRMTVFYPHGSPSQVVDVFGGDAEKQTDALWAYFNLGSIAPAPEGLPGGKSLELRVGERPVIFRTFLKDAGSRGIAVGFPIGLHFGFDAGAVRLVDAWEGSFVDAGGAWSGRGGQVAKGQGKVVWSAPPGPAVVVGPEPKSWPAKTGREAGCRFKGYGLDGAGVPTFEYTVNAPGGAVRVAERFEPDPRPDVLVKRTFTLTGVPDGTTAWITIGAKAEAVLPVSNATVEIVTRDDGAWVSVKPTDAAKPVTVVVEVKR